MKLTAWYVLCIMVVSVVFSIVVYEISAGEVRRGLDNVAAFRVLKVQSQTSSDLESQRRAQAERIRQNIIIGLVYSNISILIMGSAAGYWLARKTLDPIRRMHETQSQFVSDASHELRTPLAGMKAELEVYLRDKTITKSEYRELAISNLEEVNRLSNLAEVLLDLSQLSEQDGIQKEFFSVSSVIQNAIKSFKKSPISIHYTASEKDIFVCANEQTFSQLIHILLDNACKYASDGSVVSMRHLLKNGQLSIEFLNEAEPISEPDLAHIFERFYRGDRSRNSTGYGLGLALAQRIILLHRGSISIKNKSLKGKTCVAATILLPNASHNKNKIKA